MTKLNKRKIQNILGKIDALRKAVEGLLEDESQVSSGKNRASEVSQTSEISQQIIDSIDEMSEEMLKERLKTLKHKELGEVFVSIGGSSVDKKKPKNWLIGRIIWLSKQFSESHKSIRES